MTSLWRNNGWSSGVGSPSLDIIHRQSDQIDVMETKVVTIQINFCRRRSPQFVWPEARLLKNHKIIFVGGSCHSLLWLKATSIWSLRYGDYRYALQDATLTKVTDSDVGHNYIRSLIWSVYLQETTNVLNKGGRLCRPICIVHSYIGLIIYYYQIYQWNHNYISYSYKLCLNG